MYISIRRVRRMLHVHQINSIHLSKKGKKKNRWFGWLWMFGDWIVRLFRQSAWFSIILNDMNLYREKSNHTTLPPPPRKKKPKKKNHTHANKNKVSEQIISTISMFLFIIIKIVVIIFIVTIIIIFANMMIYIYLEWNPTVRHDKKYSFRYLPLKAFNMKR